MNNISPVNNPELDYLAKAANSAEFELWQYYNHICECHSKYINSARKDLKESCLEEIRESAQKMAALIKQILASKNITVSFIRNIGTAVKPTLTSHYLNLTQLFLGFIHASSPGVKMQHLTALLYHLNDLAEVTEITSAEPEKLLDNLQD